MMLTSSFRGVAGIVLAAAMLAGCATASGPRGLTGGYTDAKLADGPSMIDRLTNYQMFGQANGLHAALIESQWRK